jgi:hypothetical protein
VLEIIMSKAQTAHIRHITIFMLLFFGVILCIISLGAEMIGIDITPGFGIVQMVQLLLGITFLTLAGFTYLKQLRPNGTPRSLQADIGVRLASTGLVFAYVTGLSDIIGIGTHVEPSFERPFVGPLQLGGLALGVISIIIGLLLYYTSRGARDTSSMEFLVNNGK